MGNADIQGKLWGVAVADWAELAEVHHEPYWRAMLTHLEIGPESNLLDSGCGAGRGRSGAFAGRSSAVGDVERYYYSAYCCGVQGGVCAGFFGVAGEFAAVC